MKTISDNSFFNLGISCISTLLNNNSRNTTFAIEITHHNIMDIIFFFERECYYSVFLYCNSANMIPLAFFFKKRFRNVFVFCNSKSTLNPFYFKESTSVNLKHRIFLLPKNCNVNITRCEFDILRSCVNGDDVFKYTKARGISTKTYYRQRKSLMGKLKISKINLINYSKGS